MQVGFRKPFYQIFQWKCNIKEFFFRLVDDWNAALLQPSSANIQKPLESPVIRIYMSAPKEMAKEMKTFKEVKYCRLNLPVSTCMKNMFCCASKCQSFAWLSWRFFHSLEAFQDDQMKKYQGFFVWRKIDLLVYPNTLEKQCCTSQQNSNFLIWRWNLSWENSGITVQVIDATGN